MLSVFQREQFCYFLFSSLEVIDMLILKVVFSLWGANAIIFFLIEGKHIRNGGVSIHTILCGHCQYTCIHDY